MKVQSKEQDEVQNEVSDIVIVEEQEEKRPEISSHAEGENSIETESDKGDNFGEKEKAEDFDGAEQNHIDEHRIPESEWDILDFVDVFGEKYTTYVNPYVRKHQYSNDGFTRKGYSLFYDDDNYSSRLGVDVSRHQGAIDWEAVKEAGFDFAFIRIGYRGYGKEGRVRLDERFHENIRGAQNAGIDVGVYFFAQAISEEEAKEEAEFVLSTLEGYELQLPVVYDPESILDDVARTDDVSGEQFTRNTRVFCDIIRQNGYEPMIYSNMLWEAFEFDLEELAELPIWYADYEKYPQTPYDFEFWQYTNEGYISGVSGRTDLNIQIIKKNHQE